MVPPLPLERSRAFRPDWTVAKLLYGFNMPTIFSWGYLRGGRSSGFRLFVPANSSAFVVGGIHLTNQPFMPMKALKAITCTECTHLAEELTALAGLRSRHAVNREQLRAAALQAWCNPQWASRTSPLSELSAVQKRVVFVPWFLECNPSRFPYMHSRPDPRNAALASAINAILEHHSAS